MRYIQGAIIANWKNFFICLLSIYISSFMKYVSKFLSLFKLGLFIFITKWELFVYKSFVLYVYSEYFLGYGLPIYFFISIFWRV